MHDMREELEDLAFRQLSPEIYSLDRSPARHFARPSKGVIKEIESELTEELAKKKIKAKGQRPREAALFDLAKDGVKLVSQQLSDIYGFAWSCLRSRTATAASASFIQWPFVPTLQGLHLSPDRIGAASRGL